MFDNQRFDARRRFDEFQAGVGAEHEDRGRQGVCIRASLGDDRNRNEPDGRAAATWVYDVGVSSAVDGDKLLVIARGGDRAVCAAKGREQTSQEA